MRLGIFAKTFARTTVDDVFAAVAAAGLATTQFNLVLTPLGTSLPETIPDAIAAEVRAGARAHEVEVVAVSGTYNMAHPDPRARAGGLQRLSAVIERAGALGTRCVTVCTGSRDADDMWRWHPDNASAEAWADMRASIEAALVMAERHGVVLGFEPEHNNVVADAVGARRLMDELGYPRHLQVVIDPANLFPGGGLDAQDAVLAEAFDLLGDDLVLAHAKDVTADGRIVAAGQGALDYARYGALLRAAAPDLPLVLHGLAEDEVATCVSYVREAVG
jgi:sugar phosphate isomerase/epimerase